MAAVPGEYRPRTSSQASSGREECTGPERGSPVGQRSTEPHSQQGSQCLAFLLTPKGGSGAAGDGVGAGGLSHQKAVCMVGRRNGQDCHSPPGPTLAWFPSRQGCPRPCTQAGSGLGTEAGATVSPPSWCIDTHGG